MANDPLIFGNKTAEELVRFYQEERDKLPHADGNRWYLFIKELRVANNCSLDEAHRIAIADPVWRRWLQRRINDNPQCRKSALWHIRDQGDQALITQDGDMLVVR